MRVVWKGILISTSVGLSIIDAAIRDVNHSKNKCLLYHGRLSLWRVA